MTLTDTPDRLCQRCGLLSHHMSACFWAAEGVNRGMSLTEPLPCMLRETRQARLAEVPLLAEAVRWFEACRMLRDFENRHLLVNPGSDDLRAHRVVIADLIADGEILAWQARQSRVDLSAADFKIEDIEAETRLLRDNARMFHEPMPAEEAEHILKEVFGQSRA
jgi:hypothetical protein